MHKNTLLQITRNSMGAGSEELGLKLITNYFKILDADNRLPKIIVFYNEGVKLICEASPIIDSLKNLKEKGVQIVACKTCLDFYQITNQVQVGNIGSMPDIITLQADCDKIISL